MPKILKIEPSLCTGCMQCELACSWVQTGTFQPSRSVIRVNVFDEEASYAPYVEHDGCYYILISGLASHTANLKKSGMASILFMDNCDNVHAFAQKRLTCHCTATAVTREGDLFASLMALMEESFGKLITTLRGLNDFQLFQLSPIKGNFVAGFGQAFEVDFPLGGDIRHKKPG